MAKLGRKFKSPTFALPPSTFTDLALVGIQHWGSPAEVLVWPPVAV